MKLLFWTTLLLASNVCLSQIIIQGSFSVPLEDIEDELDEIMEEDGEEEVVIYYEEDYDDDDDVHDYDSYESIEESDEFVDSYEDSSESSESSEERGGRRRNKKNGKWQSRQRWAVKKIKQFMNRHNLSDVDDVPGRRFGQGLRRIHNRRDEESPRGKAAKVYRKVIRVVERKIARRDGGKFSRICERLPNRDEPRRRNQEALPEYVREQFLEMFESRMDQLEECCDLDGDDDLQEDCFQDAYEMKMDDLCTIQFQMEGETSESQSMFLLKLGERQECCQILEPRERGQCFREGGKRARQARRSRERRAVKPEDDDDDDLRNWRSMSPQQKVDKVCQRIEQHGGEIIARRANARQKSGNARTWRQENLEHRFEAMQECCNSSGTQRLECADNLKRQKLRELCVEPTARIQGYRGREKQEVQEQCCSLQGAEQEDCFDEAIHEHIMQKRERKAEIRQRVQELKTERTQNGNAAKGRGNGPNRQMAKQDRQGRNQHAKQGRPAKNKQAKQKERQQMRQEARQERRQQFRQEAKEGARQERQGLKKEARQAVRQGRRQERREQRRVRVEIEEEVEANANPGRTKRSVDDNERPEGRGTRWHHRRGNRRRDSHHRQELDEDFDREAHREMMEECCAQGRTYGETIEIPNDGLARRTLGNMCYERAREVSADIHDDDFDRKCLWSYKKCCYTSHFEVEEGQRPWRDHGNKKHRHGRRRKIRVEIEEDLEDDDGDDVIEEMIERAEIMVVDGQL